MSTVCVHTEACISLMCSQRKAQYEWKINHTNMTSILVVVMLIRAYIFMKNKHWKIRIVVYVNFTPIWFLKVCHILKIQATYFKIKILKHIHYIILKIFHNNDFYCYCRILEYLSIMHWWMHFIIFKDPNFSKVCRKNNCMLFCICNKKDKKLIPCQTTK